MEIHACRVCLATETSLHSFSEQNVKAAFEDILGSSVNLNSDLPKDICGLCKVRILRYMEFRKWCQHVQGLLNTKLSKGVQITKGLMKEINSTFPMQNVIVTQANISIHSSETQMLTDFTDLNQDQYVEEYLDIDDHKESVIAATDIVIKEPELFKNNIKTKASISTRLAYEDLVQEFVNTDKTSDITNTNNDNKGKSVEVEMVQPKAKSRQNNLFTLVARQDVHVKPKKIKVETKSETENKMLINDEDIKQEKFPLEYKLHATTITKVGKTNEKPLKAGQKVLVKNKLFIKGQTMDFKDEIGDKMRIMVTKWQCAFCKYVFLSEEALRRHLDLCSGHDSPCGLCGESFPCLKRLFEHMAAEHNDKSDKTLVCFECNMEFKKEMTLHRHWIHVHRLKKKRPRDRSCEKRQQEGMVCEQCGKQFKAPSQLRIHMTKHTGERPYQCDVCHKTFRVEMTLRTHKLMHSGEKPYKCSMCPSSFRQSSHLRRHIRTHTGEKPYLCSVCPKAFSQDWNRDEHVRTVHEGLPPKPRPGKLKKHHQTNEQTLSID